MIVIHQEEIIEVPADLPGRRHRRVDIKVFSSRKCRNYSRQRAHLNVGRQLLLRLNTLLLLLPFALPSEIHRQAGGNECRYSGEQNRPEETVFMDRPSFLDLHGDLTARLPVAHIDLC